MKCAQRGVVVLGSPVGHPAFVQAWAEDRLRAEQELLDQLPKLPDLQCAWLLLLLSALGGLGLQPAEAIAPAAWADALPAINARLPSSAATYMRLLESEAVGAEGQVVPDMACAARAVARPHNRYRRPNRGPSAPRPCRLRLHCQWRALCCDVTLSPLTRTGHPHPCTVEVDGAALKVAGASTARTRSSAKAAGARLGDRGPLERNSAALRCAPPAVRRAACSGCARRWWGALSVAWPSSPLQAQPWGARGQLSQRRRRATAQHWTVCSTSPLTRRPAACPCGPKPGPHVVI